MLLAETEFREDGLVGAGEIAQKLSCVLWLDVDCTFWRLKWMVGRVCVDHISAFGKVYHDGAFEQGHGLRL